MVNTTTKQEKVKTLKNGNPINTKTQFGQPGGNPRHNGAWKKEDTARYKLEQMLKLPEEEIVKIANDKEAPLFERRLARSLLKENNFKTTEAMMNQVYGQPKQKIESVITAPKPLVDLTERKKNGDN